MILDLTDKEAALINRALSTYESEPQTNAATGCLMTAVLAGLTGSGNDEGKVKADVRTQMNDASAESDKRKLEAASIRHKLAEALGRPSEFSR